MPVFDVVIGLTSREPSARGWKRVEGGNAGYRQTVVLGTGRPKVALWYFPGPLCRQVKPKATTVTHTWLSLNAHHTFCRIISTGVPKQTVVFDLTLGFLNHTAGIIDYLMAHLQPTLNKFWTNKQTDIHTYNVFRGPGWRFRRHCHASPSSTIIYNAI